MLTITNHDLEFQDEELAPERGALYEGKPLTGVVMIDRNGRHAEWTYIDGKADGRWFELFPNGSLYEEMFMSDGEEVTTTRWYEDGSLGYRYTSEPYYEVCWYKNGQMRFERSNDVRRSWDENGALREEYDSESKQCTFFTPDDTWYMRVRTENTRSIVLSPERITFNEEYLQEGFRQILEADIEILPKLLIWFNHRSASDQERITAELLRSENLQVKFEGLILVQRHRMTGLIPLVKEQRSIHVVPDKRDSLWYTITVGKYARRVLRDLKQKRITILTKRSK